MKENHINFMKVPYEPIVFITFNDRKSNPVTLIVDDQCFEYVLITKEKNQYDIEIYNDCGNLICKNPSHFKRKDLRELFELPRKKKK